MDREQFDRLTRWLTAATSRRGAIGSTFAGLTALLLGGDRLTAEPGGNGKGKGNGQEKGIGNKPEKAPKAKGKVWLCHQPQSIIDPLTGLADVTRPNTRHGTLLLVSGSAKGSANKKGKLRGHLRHGDGQCLEDLTATTLIQGASCEVDLDPTTRAVTATRCVLA